MRHGSVERRVTGVKQPIEIAVLPTNHELKSAAERLDHVQCRPYTQLGERLAGVLRAGARSDGHTWEVAAKISRG